MLSKFVQQSHPCFQTALRSFAYAPRVPSGATGEPLTVTELKQLGMKNYQQTKVLNYADIIPKEYGKKNEFDSFVSYD